MNSSDVTFEKSSSIADQSFPISALSRTSGPFRIPFSIWHFSAIIIEINKKYSESWPNISKKRKDDVPNDEKKWRDVKDKMKYFSEKPGKGD